jgi:hypothetical protein
VKIGRTVEKLYKGVIFHENSLVAPLKRILRIFEVFMFFRLSSRIDRYIVCGIWLFFVKKFFWGIFSQKLPGRSPSMKFETFLIIQNFSSCQTKSIGMLIVKIGRTDEKLFKGEFFHENSPPAPLE